MTLTHLAFEVRDLFASKQWTLSTAESCTGGALSAELTKVAGASDYFLGGVIAYSNEVKIKLLGVDPAVLVGHGAVSAETVAQMSEGILALTDSDFAVAVSGVAGPAGGTADKPVGTVWCSILRGAEKPYVWQLHLTGDREQIIAAAVQSLLQKILSYAKQKKD